MDSQLPAPICEMLVHQRNVAALQAASKSAGALVLFDHGDEPHTAGDSGHLPLHGRRTAGMGVATLVQQQRGLRGAIAGETPPREFGVINKPAQHSMQSMQNRPAVVPQVNNTSTLPVRYKYAPSTAKYSAYPTLSAPDPHAGLTYGTPAQRRGQPQSGAGSQLESENAPIAATVRQGVTGDGFQSFKTIFGGRHGREANRILLSSANHPTLCPTAALPCPTAVDRKFSTLVWVKFLPIADLLEDFSDLELVDDLAHKLQHDTATRCSRLDSILKELEVCSDGTVRLFDRLRTS